MQLPVLLLYPSKPSPSDEERLAAYHKEHAQLPSLEECMRRSPVVRAVIHNIAMRQLGSVLCLSGVAQAWLAPVLAAVEELHGPSKKPSRKSKKK